MLLAIRSAYFYSHASCEARPLRHLIQFVNKRISTHTPLARRDARQDLSVVYSSDFYSHASCEARPSACRVKSFPRKFLLTRLLRGATHTVADACDTAHISTHTPLARRDRKHFDHSVVKFISTHTPLARRDGSVSAWLHTLIKFLLTRLLRGATIIAWAPGTEPTNFYSHASCEARLYSKWYESVYQKFLLTRLLRGATSPPKLARIIL